MKKTNDFTVACVRLSFAVFAGAIPSLARADVVPSCLSNGGLRSAAQDNRRFKILDEMDFNIFTHQQWDRIGESHSQDIFVQNPDMTTTTELPPHVDGMKFIASFIPDVRVTGHPVCVSSGDWTAIIGVLEGTFSKPMINPAAAAPLPPTNKPFRIQMATISHWRGGLMDQEILFWDNTDFDRQMGLIKGAPAPKGDPGPVPPSGTDAGVSDQEVNRRLRALGDLDSVAWTYRDWAKVSAAHADDVVVVMPDGTVVTGVVNRTAQLKQVPIWAPDARVTRHPIMFGQGAWTVMTSEMEGTFTAPMPGPGGSPPVLPTGKMFKLQTATYSHWNAQGMVDREYLFRDTQALMKQIGLAP